MAFFIKIYPFLQNHDENRPSLDFKFNVFKSIYVKVNHIWLIFESLIHNIEYY